MGYQKWDTRSTNLTGIRDYDSENTFQLVDLVPHRRLTSGLNSISVKLHLYNFFDWDFQTNTILVLI